VWFFFTRQLLRDLPAPEAHSLYNMESIIEYKLNKKSGVELLPEREAKMAHIRGLKDVVELKLTKTPGSVFCQTVVGGLRLVILAASKVRLLRRVVAARFL
jgi:hypothetical protein